MPAGGRGAGRGWRQRPCRVALLAEPPGWFLLAGLGPSQGSSMATNGGEEEEREPLKPKVQAPQWFKGSE